MDFSNTQIPNTSPKLQTRTSLQPAQLKPHPISPTNILETVQEKVTRPRNSSLTFSTSSPKNDQDPHSPTYHFVYNENDHSVFDNKKTNRKRN